MNSILHKLIKENNSLKSSLGYSKDQLSNSLLGKKSIQSQKFNRGYGAKRQSMKQKEESRLLKSLILAN